MYLYLQMIPHTVSQENTIMAHQLEPTTVKDLKFR